MEKVVIGVGAAVVALAAVFGYGWVSEYRATAKAHDAIADVFAAHAEEHLKSAQTESGASEVAKKRTAAEWIAEDLKSLHALISIETRRIQQQQAAQQRQASGTRASAGCRPTSAGGGGGAPCTATICAGCGTI